MTLLSCWQRLVRLGLLKPHASSAVAAPELVMRPNRVRLVNNQRACSLSGLDGQVPEAVTRGCAVPCHGAGKR
jgi:hypothetical protein